MSNNIVLEDKLVGQIHGEFVIPSYQRGYRWEPLQVRTLLDDIYQNGQKTYCLQPVVVRQMENGKYELIDGQQRLTTLYILIKYLKAHNAWMKMNYSLEYETRKKSGTFLDQLDDTMAEDNIDFHFIYQAYSTVSAWFCSKSLGDENKMFEIAIDMMQFLMKFVKVIWYEVKNVKDEDAISLFTRLNIGRIPLTNAELVKALFLCRITCEEKEERQQNEIALQWDTMERELHDEQFWSFLTRNKSSDYSSRIELIFDFMVPNSEKSKDRYSTFYYFSKRRDELENLWQEVVRYYYHLKEWYQKNVFYHKMGYLVASRWMRMNEIVDATRDMRKSQIDNFLNEKIKESMRFDYSDLNYKNNYDEISRLLLLFNVVSVMNGNGEARFPFKIYNREIWSLEHIFPQHPDQLKMKNDQELWRAWVRSNLASVKELPEVDIFSTEEKGALFDRMQSFLQKEKVTEQEFDDLSTAIMNCLNDKTEEDLTHSLSNMALLQKDKNSALNNALFDAKRRRMIDMDRNGEYIPYCTRMVFQKYYTQRVDMKQMFVWSSNDRTDYIKAINNVLKPYLAEEIEA